jgi:hypothetical protein
MKEYNNQLGFIYNEDIWKKKRLVQVMGGASNPVLGSSLIFVTLAICRVTISWRSVDLA